MTNLKVLNISYLLAVLTLASCSFISEQSAVDESDGMDRTEEPSEGESDSSEPKREDITEEEEQDYTEIELLSEAHRSYDAGRYMISKTFFEKIIQNYPGSPLALTAELKIADCSFFADRYIESIPLYREFAKLHSKHEARPYALYRIADAFQKSYQGTKQDLTPLNEAIKQYIALVNEYPNSIYSKLATGRIIEAEEALLKSEISVIDFYERTGDQKSADKRKRDLKKLFGHLKLYSSLFPDFEEENKEIATLSDENPQESNEVKTEETEINPSLEIPSVSSSPSAISSVQVEETATPSASQLPSLMPSHSPYPSPTTELLEGKKIDILATSSTPIPSQTISNQDLGIKRTLADLEEENEQKPTPFSNPTEKNLDSGLSSAIEHEIQSDKQNINTGIFLKSHHCEQEDGVLKIYLKFRSKPFIKSSRKDHDVKNLTTIIFQDGFSTESLPEFSNSTEWSIEPEKICMEIGAESVVVQEVNKVETATDNFGPKSFLMVHISSAKLSKVSIVNGSSPESLAIVAQ